MFEEGQLYSPVTAGKDGEVTVHLADDHPGAGDPDYQARRNEIAALALAWKPGQPAPTSATTMPSRRSGAPSARELAPKHDRSRSTSSSRRRRRSTCRPTECRASTWSASGCALSRASTTCRPPGSCRCASSTGRCRTGSSTPPSTSATRPVPLYTPEPDIIHEVFGHGHLLATPTFSELHRLTGEATHRLRDDENLRFLSRVFWFSVEFGVVVEDGELKAYGAGILSSYGEIDEFREMEHRPLDLVEMGTADYDITHYQPVLYRAESLDEVREVVGGFLRTCTDESIAELRARGPASAPSEAVTPPASSRLSQ